jgi:hypothetical protein
LPSEVIENVEPDRDGSIGNLSMLKEKGQAGRL